MSLTTKEAKDLKKSDAQVVIHMTKSNTEMKFTSLVRLGGMNRADFIKFEESLVQALETVRSNTPSQ